MTATAPEVDVARLAAIGVPEPAARAYAFLVRHGPATAREVAKATGLHRSRAYGVLETVEKLGLAEAVLEEPRRFVALPLAPFIDRAVAKAEEDARTAEGAVRLVRHLFPDGGVQPEGAFGEMRLATGRRRASASVARALLDASTSVRWLVTGPGLARLANHMEGADAVDALASGARDVRVLVVGADDAELASVRDLLPAHVVRAAPVTLAGLGQRLVVDGTRLFTTFPDPDDARAYRGKDTCLETTIPALVRDAEDFFDRVWREAPPRVPAAERSRGSPHVEG